MRRRCRRWTSPVTRPAWKWASYGKAAPMELLQGEAFDNLSRTCARSAFHLEVHDTYQTSDESGLFKQFLSGEPDDFAWHRAACRLAEFEDLEAGVRQADPDRGRHPGLVPALRRPRPGPRSDR